MLQQAEMQTAAKARKKARPQDPQNAKRRRGEDAVVTPEGKRHCTVVVPSDSEKVAEIQSSPGSSLMAQLWLSDT